MSIFIARHGLLYSLAIIITQTLYVWFVIKIYIIPSNVPIHASDYFYRGFGNMIICIVLCLSSHQNFGTYAYICECYHNRVQKCFAIQNPKQFASHRKKHVLYVKPTMDHSSLTTPTLTPGNNRTLSTWTPGNNHTPNMGPIVN